MANRSPERLGDFIRRIRTEKGLSLKAVSRQSARFGPGISAGYINRIENEPKRKPTVEALKALAPGLGIPVEELLARAAHQVRPSGVESDELRLLARFRELSADRKVDVLDVVEFWHSKEVSRRTPRRRSAG